MEWAVLAASVAAWARSAVLPALVVVPASFGGEEGTKGVVEAVSGYLVVLDEQVGENGLVELAAYFWTGVQVELRKVCEEAQALVDVGGDPSTPQPGDAFTQDNTYNAAGQIVKSVMTKAGRTAQTPAQDVTTFTYDGAGNRIKESASIDPGVPPIASLEKRPGSREKNFGYDPENRLITVDGVKTNPGMFPVADKADSAATTASSTVTAPSSSPVASTTAPAGGATPSAAQHYAADPAKPSTEQGSLAQGSLNGVGSSNQGSSTGSLGSAGGSTGDGPGSLGTTLPSGSNYLRTHDALGRLVNETTDGKVTSWTHDGLDPIYATGVAGTNTYLRDDIGALLGEVGAGTNGAEWYVTDALRTIYGRVSAGGAFTNGTVDYSDYGVEIQTPQSVRPTAGATGASGAVASWGFDENPPRFAFGYTGERTDPSRGGMNHFVSRGYDPITAAWMGQDRERGLQVLPESMNRYLYVLGSPSSFRDLYGYSWWNDAWNAGKKFLSDNKRTIITTAVAVAVTVALAVPVAAACAATAGIGCFAAGAVAGIAAGYAGGFAGGLVDYYGSSGKKSFGGALAAGNQGGSNEALWGAVGGGAGATGGKILAKYGAKYLAPHARNLGHKLMDGLNSLGKRGTSVSNAKFPTVEFSSSKAPNIAKTFDEAVSKGAPTTLNRVDALTRDANRRAALKGQERPGSGLSLDEYPFACSAQGGCGATVRPVPVAEQSYQGGVLRQFFAKNDVKPGDPFEVRFRP
jgi:RHS repeat-associated protein